MMMHGVGRNRIVAVAALCGCAIGAAAQNQIPATDPGTADAQPQPDKGAVQWGGPAEGEAAPGPGHPPIDEIPPMPMPEPGEGGPGGGDAGVPLAHDAETGETFEYPLYPSSGMPGGEGPGYRAPFGEWLDERFSVAGFGTMSQINAVGSDPWRRNAKVVMRFVDEAGNDRFFVCSGTMADPETVLVAAHCVYAHDASGPDINDWAEEIWVYPGWDGDGAQFSEPSGIIQTHGVARGTFFGAFTGWTEDENFDWDVGLIRVNRAAGQLTGWFGYAWGFGCGTIQNRNYNNASYPAEGCPMSGLHTGRDMYYWDGTIDSCPGNQMEIDTGSGCFTALWGGMSGSGVYYFNDNDNRLVHGVASNSNRSSIGRYAKIWENFKDYMLDFEDDARGSSLDLQMLRARYVEDTVTAGDSIEGDDYFVANPTNANPPSDSYSVTHYLSTNSNISAADTAIGGESFTFNFAPIQGVNVNNTGITYEIPIDTPSGTYYAGAILDTDDANNGNNDGDDWDAQEIEVDGVADIVAESVDAPGATQFLGEDMEVDFQVRNQGGDSSNPVSVEIRASTNDFISESDPLLGSFTLFGLSGGASVDESRTVTIPESLGTGDYYIGIIASSSDDVDSSNDTAFDSSQVTVGERPANDDCADAIVVGEGTFNFSNTNASTDGPTEGQCSKFGYDQVGSDIWYSYTPSCDGEVTVSLCGSDYDTKVAVYDAPCPFGSGTAIACNDDSCDLQSEVTFDASAGTEYLIRIGGYQGAQGSGTAMISCNEPCPADLTGDGQVTSSDFLAYIDLFAAGDPEADFTGDGQVTSSDFLAYIDAFAQGCP